jgi:hypothetical protein
MLGFLYYGRWQMRFNDPNPSGWIITLLYAGAAYLCYRAARAERAHEHSSAEPLWPRFWVIATWVVGALGVNKQLDLQSLMTEVGRDVARAVGLYGARRGIQFVFILLLAAGGAAAVYAGYRRLGRAYWRRYRLAYVGGCALVTFIVIRAASLHHVDDALYHTSWGRHWVNTVLEAGAIGTVGYAAYLAMTQGYGNKYQVHEKRVRVR